MEGATDTGLRHFAEDDHCDGEAEGSHGDTERRFGIDVGGQDSVIHTDAVK